MSDRPSSANQVPANTVGFGEKFARSDHFMAVFREGMALVEETAAYLDGDGRTESRILSRLASLTYATESMRLTTRLMQVASWLLLHRAINEGELTMEEARSEKRKVRLQDLPAARTSPAFDELPERLRDLIARSHRLHERVVAIDRMMYASRATAQPTEQGVRDQLGALHAAFGGE